MALSVSKSFTAVEQVSSYLLVKHNQEFYYSVSGTFVATLVIEKSNDGGLSFFQVGSSIAAAASGYIKANHSEQSHALYRIRCSAYTSGTAVTVLLGAQAGKRQIHGCGVVAKVGATAGWVVAAANNLCLATCPASQTASTLVVPVRGLKLGDRVTGFHLIGQIESAGGAVTVDCELRKHTAAAADVVDASVASITQVSVTADAVLGPINSSSPEFPCVVADGETFYFLITATTAASTDIALQGIAVFVEEA